MSQAPWLGQLHQELAQRAIMDEYFPVLTRHGLTDTDVAIHSHMLTYLATVGQQLGFAAVVECPLPAAAHISPHLANIGDVRADAVWFARNDNSPIAAFEFERFETRRDESQLRHKLENLAIMVHRSGRRLQHCFLVYWLRSGTAPHDLRAVCTGYETGFTRNGVHIPPPNCPLTIVKCVFGQRGGHLVVGDLLVVERIKQGSIA